MASESELLKKFRMIMNISQEVSQAQVAKHLGLTESDLFGYLIEWSDTIPFKIRGKMIVIEDINDFMKKLDSQYNTWSDNVLISFDPIKNEPLTTFAELFGDDSSAQPQPVKKTQIEVKVKSVPDLEEQRGADPVSSTDTLPTPSPSLDELVDFDLEGRDEEVLEIEGKGLTAFPKDIFINHLDVEEIYLAENEIKTIPSKITQLKNLKILDLVENKIQVIPRALANVSKLSELHLSSNKISEIPEWISSLTKLKHLYLDHNQINSIPKSILKLKKLKEFHIEYNYLSESDAAIQKMVAALKEKGCWVKIGVQLTKAKGTQDKLTVIGVLSIIPKEEWKSVKDIIKLAKIIDMEKAQQLQTLLADLVGDNKLDFTIRNGRKYWKKR